MGKGWDAEMLQWDVSVEALLMARPETQNEHRQGSGSRAEGRLPGFTVGFPPPRPPRRRYS